MRLIRLKVRNIASLKGEHEIDFLEIQRMSSLFAITGETGSGKSTVLNCIGLALYGQIYKKNVNQLDVVTLGEKDGSIELIFQVKEKFYLADWRARVRKQNGEPYATAQTPVRNLYEVDGNEFSSPKNISEKNSTELLNLDFDQFCKCIILNQGEFAKFLASSFSERKDILEKLYPGDLLDNISRELDNEKKALEKVKHDIDIELQTLKGDIDPGLDLKAEKNKLESDLKALDAKLILHEKLDYHFISLFSYFEKFAENERKKESISQDLTEETRKFNHLLKTGEALQERFNLAQKEQENQLPELQKLVKSEETLKNLKESFQQLEKKELTLTHEKTSINDKLAAIQADEELIREKLTASLAKLTSPLQDLKDGKDQCLELIDLFHEKEILAEEVKGKKLRFNELETSGLELKAQTEKIDEAIKLLPKNIQELEGALLLKKKDLQNKTDQGQRAVISSEELKKQVLLLNTEMKNFADTRTQLDHKINQTRELIFPLETTLKLQEVLNASSICIEHVMAEKKESCPVCESQVSHSRWQELKQQLDSTDLNSLRKKYDEGREILFQSEKEKEHLLSREEKSKTELALKEKNLLELSELLSLKLPLMDELDQELDDIRRKSLELQGLEKDRTQKTLELQKVRDQYLALKKELGEREKSLSEKTSKLDALAGKIRNIIPVISKDRVRDLNQEMKDLNLCLGQESSLDKVLQMKVHLNEVLSKISTELRELVQNKQDHLRRITVLTAELEKSLGTAKASDLITKLNLNVKTSSEDWSRHKDVQKKQEQILTEFRTMLSQKEELKKDYDFQFTSELHSLRKLAQTTTEPTLLIEKLKTLGLELSSPKELFPPLQDLIRQEKDLYKNQVNECRMKFASVSTKLSAWEKLQDKITLLEIKAKEVNTGLERKQRLSEVLGKDELRTFVLSLVEENLIHQTNEELQKLCQGRYEIIHQTKAMRMTPEFFILDKFREGGKRKVSTLSGGETFMVSLAMALGLAEMTRGQAEIDSLFIDEGFGTLDQDSLEDVLDMLQQIQTRGLMVGIISHIKTLTNSIPVNLVLNKKQDGTSVATIVHN